VLLSLLVFGMDIQQAIDAARFRHIDGYRSKSKRRSRTVCAPLTAMGT
jgi:gamma-glutamyltranspeptidase